MSTLVGSGVLPFRRRARDSCPADAGILSPLKNWVFVAFLAGSLVGSFGSRLAVRYRLVSVPAITEDHVVPKMAPLELPAALAHEGAALMITLEYVIDPGRTSEFEALMHEVGAIRRRAGATFWALFVDGPMRATYFEYFVVESGLDARRMHDRMTDPARELMGRAHAFHLKGERPPAQHHEMICYGGAWETHRPGR